MSTLLGYLLGVTPKKDMQLPTISEADLPVTVADAIELMVAIIPKQVQDEIRAIKSEDVEQLHFSLGMWARKNFRLWNKDSEIRKQIGTVCPDNASSIIIWAFWERLQQSECSIVAVKS
jgi:hypothetical protein